MIYQLNNDIPEIDQASFIAPSADVIGKVILKKKRQYLVQYRDKS